MRTSPRPRPRAATRPADETPVPLGARPLRMRIAVAAGLALTLVALLGHAVFYRFLTDDAFISFRYARNLAHGHGLVFNPGFERVEGYSDFLWVLVLAGLDRVGLVPETAAPVLGLLLTIALWSLVAWYALRTPPEPGREWLILVPTTLLTLTRSVAVWSTSGLETRLFETLVVAGVLRLMVELDGRVRGEPVRSLAVWLLGLAALTRPDGLPIALSIFAAALLWIRTRRPSAARAFLAGLFPFVLIVGGHFLFRRIYYGEWLPNTYYAKVGGRLWWSAGWRYLLAWAIEYAVYLWVPFVVAAIAWHRRRGASLVVVLFASVILPHALYVAAIGGDHFEYRPLDLYFPFAFLLIGDGAKALARSRTRAAVVAMALLLVAIGLWQLPWQSQRQFPKRPVLAFPGTSGADPDAATYLASDRDPLYRLPLLREIAALHRALLGTLSEELVGLRREEHRSFLASVEPEGHRLRDLVARGVLPRDAYVAIDCVGAIPYYSDLRILDRHGLTDRAVARSASIGARRMAHEKSARFEDARARGVELWAADEVHCLVPATSKRMLKEVRDAVRQENDVYAADAGNGDYLVCRLPQGTARLSERMPGLRFRRLVDPEFNAEFLARNLAALQDSVRRDPRNPDSRQRLAYFLLLDQRYAAALVLYLEQARSTPGNPFVWESVALCRENLGDAVGAGEANRRALSLYEASGDLGNAGRVRAKLQR